MTQGGRQRALPDVAGGRGRWLGYRAVAWLALIVAVSCLTACGGGHHNVRPGSRGGSGGSARGGYDDISKSQSSRYRSSRDSVPTDIPDVSKLPEPVPKTEPRSLYGNKSPYSVLGQTYTVMDNPRGYVERGIASFYGNKFHGYKTSNLEEYDMYQFSAAHKTLPLPSYARVTNLENGKSVIVRINDRGPFHENRLIDLSFAAAVKIGVWPKGTGLVEVRAIDPRDPSSAAAPAVVTTPRPAPVTAPPPPVRTWAAPAGARTAATPASVAAAAALAGTPRPAPTSTTATPVATGNPADAGPVAGMTDASVADALPALPGKPASPSPVIATRPAATASPAAVPGKPSIYLQVGAFSDMANARRVADQLNRAGLGPVSVIEASVGGRTVRKVRVGPLADVDTADRVTDQIAGMGLPRPQVAVD
ncbi:septal ring lytic transglycosylase RlpA family protein [Luteibacter sahnii]